MSASPPATQSTDADALAAAYKEVLPGLKRASDLSSADQEDVVHDAYIRALSQKSGAIRNPVWYLLRAARNLIIDRHRRRKQSGHVLQPNETLVETATTSLDPERILSGQQRLAIVNAAIERLPPRCGEALRLHRFSGLSYPEIARHMQISTSMVEKHIAEAMLRLSEALEQADRGSSLP